MNFGFNPQRLFRDDDNIPFACIYSEGDTKSRNSLRAGQFPGLISCHSIRLDDCGKIIAYWRNESGYRADGAEFGRLLECGLKEFAGVVVDLKKHPKKRLGWLMIKNGLIAAAALFGALSVIQDYYARLLRPADVAVQFADSAPIDVLDRSPFTLQFNVINEDRYAPAKVWVTSAEAISRERPDSPIRLKAAEIISSRLDPGSTISGIMSGQTPILTTKKPGPADYSLSVAILAKEGLFWPKSKFQAPERVLRIWPRLSWNSPTVEHFGNKLCTLKGIIFSGRAYPHGVMGQMSAVADVPISVEVSRTVKQKLYSTGMGKRVTVMFTSEPLQAFTKYEYFVTISAVSPVARDKWLGIGKSLELTLRPPE